MRKAVSTNKYIIRIFILKGNISFSYLTFVLRRNKNKPNYIYYNLQRKNMGEFFKCTLNGGCMLHFHALQIFYWFLIILVENENFLQVVCC
jgi:hypothetical protein